MKRAFTLVELLVVIAIIAMLASLMHPVLQNARDKANTVACSSNLRQFGQILAAYLNDSRGFYPRSEQNHFGSNITWDDRLGAGYDGRELSEADQRRVRWLGNPGETRVYRCPAMKFPPMGEPNAPVYKTYYLTRGVDIATHPHWRTAAGVSHNDWSLQIIRAANPSRTIVMGEGGGPTIMGYPYGSLMDGSQNHAVSGVIIGLHGEGRFNYLMMDGHVENLHYTETGDPGIPGYYRMDTRWSWRPGMRP